MSQQDQRREGQDDGKVHIQHEQYANLLAVIEKLSISVSETSKELDENKLKYMRKMAELNDMIRHLKVEFASKGDSIDAKEELKLVRKESQIDNIWVDEDNKKFIVIPVQYLGKDGELSDVSDNSRIPSSKDNEINHDTVSNPTVRTGILEMDKKKKRKKKKSCSHCQEKGHSHSECPKRLYNSKVN